MAEEAERATKAQLAVALARGTSIRSWGRASDVPYVIAQRWSKDPQVRKMAQDLRRRALDRAVGKVAMRSTLDPWTSPDQLDRGGEATRTEVR